MLYFDEKIKEYESNYFYNNSLLYLEGLYKQKKSIDLLNSLIIFSWYYTIEGPIDSKKYGTEDTSFSFEIWRKYVEIIVNSECCDPSTLYFCAYSLSLHGFLLGSDMESVGAKMIESALNCCKDEKLKELIVVFQTMSNQKKYKPLKVKKEILTSIFNEESMVGQYFIEMYK